MDRRTAAATALSVALVGASMVAGAAAIGAVPFLGFGATPRLMLNLR